MKSSPHAKIVEVDGHQVLFWFEPNKNGDGYILHQQVMLDLGLADLSLNCVVKPGASHERLFEEITKIVQGRDEEHARKLITQVLGPLGELADDN